MIDPIRDLAWASVERRQPAAARASDGCRWALMVQVVGIKHANERHTAVPKPVHSRGTENEPEPDPCVRTTRSRALGRTGCRGCRNHSALAGSRAPHRCSSGPAASRGAPMTRATWRAGTRRCACCRLKCSGGVAGRRIGGATDLRDRFGHAGARR
eukprot:6192603-Pleurochrysis_carterae.AAC.3